MVDNEPCHRWSLEPSGVHVRMKLALRGDIEDAELGGRWRSSIRGGKMSCGALGRRWGGYPARTIGWREMSVNVNGAATNSEGYYGDTQSYEHACARPSFFESTMAQ